MPIIQCDATGLEIYAGAYLSKDSVMKEELRAGLDIHGLNQKALNLPEGDIGRLIAKIFIFRLMYGGSAYAYSTDTLFMQVSESEKYWQKVIDAFYDKYKGFRDWHRQILRDATRDGYLMMPTGRRYNFSLVRDFRGELKAPQTTIKNYPVQGLGADIMAIARVSFKRRFDASGYTHRPNSITGVSIGTVHDSIVCDVSSDLVEKVARVFHDVFNDLPNNFKRVFGVEFDLPLRCKVSVGPNMMDMEEYKIAA